MFKRRGVLVTLAALLAVTLTGIQGVASAREQAGPSKVVTEGVGSTADGAALLRGVFFVQGKIGSRLASLPYFHLSNEDFERNRSPEAIAVVDDVIAAIEDVKPGLLGNFSTQMRSGDPFKVEKALRGAGEALRQVAELRPALQSEAAGVIVHTEIAVVNAGAVAVAAAVVVAVAAVIVVLAVVRETPRMPNDQLAAERAVAELTQVLRTI
ncbi:hypothetical protein [Micromonospora lutea]|uniref:Antimicrobial peptide, SdpC family n=1 Tax=Micromonospora lutea TaxID=419825 RepID=A0ABQ4J1X1_9ACTN|nr:hypothetical protein [Micromonospora lutea]GIJ24188.1 hypothetical protein Vlu01_48120 [Micromonospora lutea]